MKVEGKVTYRGWENGPAWGTIKEMNLTFDFGTTEIIVKDVDDRGIAEMITQLEKLRVQLAEAPMKNAWG